MTDHIEIGRHLLATPGVTLRYSAQANKRGGLLRDDTEFVDVPLDDPEAETFTHYFTGPGSAEVEDDISYYNSCAWGEETTTLGEQQALVRGRFYPSNVLHSTRVWAIGCTPSGVICAAHVSSPPVVYPSDKDGWETPLNWYCEQTSLSHEQVVREIRAYVKELPENRTARVAVLGTNIKELIHADD